MKNSVYYVGVYGTAHETTARIEDTSGNIVGAGKAGVANIHFSVKHAWENIEKATKRALEKANLKNTKDLTLYAGIGIKNTELVEACQKLLSKNDLFDKIELASDAYTFCLGINGGSVAVIILDEGLVGNVIQGDKFIKIGGWGFPHADIGSIPWIGLEATHITLQYIDGYIENSPLIDAIYGHFSNDTSKLIDWAMNSRSNPKSYTAIAEIVFKYTETNDPNAIKIMRKAAEEIEKIYLQLCKKTENQTLPFALISPFSELMLNFLPKTICNHLIKSSGNALDGAIKLIKNNVDQK